MSVLFHFNGIFFAATRRRPSWALKRLMDQTLLCRCPTLQRKLPSPPARRRPNEWSPVIAADPTKRGQLSTGATQLVVISCGGDISGLISTYRQRDTEAIGGNSTNCVSRKLQILSVSPLLSLKKCNYRWQNLADVCWYCRLPLPSVIGMQ